MSRLLPALAAVVAAVLYGMMGQNVHANGAPPAVLDKMKLTEGQPAAPAIGFKDADGKDQENYLFSITLNDVIQSAVLNVKLTRLAQWTEQRLAHAARYDQLLSSRLDPIELERERNKIDRGIIVDDAAL